MSARIRAPVLEPPSAAARSEPGRRRLPRAALLHCLLLVAAIEWWITALARADLDEISGYGLLTALPAPYYVALLLLSLGFASAVSRDPVSPKLLAAYVVALIVVIHGTTAVLYDVPRYAWTYKHLGVIDRIGALAAYDRDVDIYNNWPGFFALNAWFSRATGLPAISYAAWAQVAFNLLNVAALQFALRGVTRDVRLLWTSAWLLILGNWVAQDYLAPQALGFVLALTVFGLCLRCAPAARPSARRSIQRPLDRLTRWALHGRPPLDEPRAPPPLEPLPALLAGGVCYLAAVVSHQLTPVMIVLGVAALAVFTRRLPLWLPAAMALVEVWWLWLAWPLLSQEFRLLDPDPIAGPRHAGYSAEAGLPGVALVGTATRGVMVLLLLLAVAGLVRRLRQGHRDVPVLALIGAAVSVAALQSYGGEALLRIFLFALPWLAFLAAAACVPAVSTARAGGLRRSWRLLAATGCIGACFLAAYFGREMMNHIRPGDVAAMRWFETHADAEAVVGVLAPNAPNRVTARYGEVQQLTDWLVLTEHEEFRGRVLGEREVPRIRRLLRGVDASERYFLVSPSQVAFTELYGLLPTRSPSSLVQALTASRDFRLVYRRGEASLFRLVDRDALAPATPP
jgi:hypothetical protein